MLVLTFTILPFGVLVLLLADRWRHPRGQERAPRCMGSIVFEKNERHAAWERSWPTAGATPAAQNERHAAWEALFLKKTSATLHGSAPGRPPAPPDHPKTTPRPPIEKVLLFHQKCCFSFGKVCKWDSQERFSLRFKARFGSFTKKS